jgi:hypothetical protein
MGSTPEAARPSGHGVEGGADRDEGIFGSRRIGKLVWCERSFGFASAGLRPPDFRRGFGHDGERVESLEPPQAFGFGAGGRVVRSPGTFGFTESEPMSDPRGSSDARGEGRTSHPMELRLRRIERAFGSKGLRSRRVRAGVRRERASAPERRAAKRPERIFGFGRAGAARHKGASAPEGRVPFGSKGLRSQRVESLLGSKALRRWRVGRPFGSQELRLRRDGRRRLESPGLRLWRRGKRPTGSEEASAFAGVSGSGTSRWNRVGPTSRGDRRRRRRTGHAVGEKLWRAQPHERIRHETRPAGSRRIEKASRGRENLRTQAAG